MAAAAASRATKLWKENQPVLFFISSLSGGPFSSLSSRFISFLMNDDLSLYWIGQPPPASYFSPPAAVPPCISGYFSHFIFFFFLCASLGVVVLFGLKKKKKIQGKFSLVLQKRREILLCACRRRREALKSLYTVSNTHTLYRAARLYYDVITFQFDVCVRLGYGNIFQKKKKTRIRNCCSFIFYWARAMLLLFLSKIIIKRKKRKKKQKKHFSSVFLWNYIFLKMRVKTLAARIPRYE